MGFFKQQEYRRFDLKPRYWDPQKEEREKRERRIKAELNIQSEDYSEIRTKFRANYNKLKTQRKKTRGSYVLRLFMILMLLLLMAYYLFSKYADRIIEWLGE